MTITSRDEFIDYIKRSLGDPVIEVNVEEQQMEDRVDEALAYWREFHSDAVHRTYIKHQMTATDIANQYITIPSDALHVIKMFSVGSNLTSSRNFFDIKYQMHLNDIADIHTYIGDLKVIWLRGFLRGSSTSNSSKSSISNCLIVFLDCF